MVVTFSVADNHMCPFAPTNNPAHSVQIDPPLNGDPVIEVSGNVVVMSDVKIDPGDVDLAPDAGGNTAARSATAPRRDIDVARTPGVGARPAGGPLHACGLPSCLSLWVR